MVPPNDVLQQTGAIKWLSSRIRQLEIEITNPDGEAPCS